MSWEGQIFIQSKKGEGEMVWVSIRCTGRYGYTYRYPTQIQAERMLDNCYPDTVSLDRKTVEVDEEANIGITEVKIAKEQLMSYFGTSNLEDLI